MRLDGPDILSKSANVHDSRFDMSFPSAQERRHTDHELSHEQGADPAVLALLAAHERLQHVRRFEQVRVRVLEPAL
jgi:hypothetical protein